MVNSQLTYDQKSLEDLQKILNVRLNKLADLELTYSTLKTRLSLFESEYYHKILSKYIEIDKLQAEIDKKYASKNPDDNELKEKAHRSEEKAFNSFKESEKYSSAPQPDRKIFQPTPELKNLYRELAKKLHPDLTTDEKEKERRHSLMLQVNEAYSHGDLDKLKKLWDNNKNNIETSADNNISKIQQLNTRILAIEDKILEIKKLINELRKSDLYQLYIKVQINLKNGIDIINQMENSLKGRINFLNEQLTKLKNLNG